MQRTIDMRVGEFALDSLTSDLAGLSQPLAQAVRYYLTDRGSGRIGWEYPDFLEQEGGCPMRQVTLRIDGEVWAEFADEAERQRVSADRLLQHAVLYLLADRDTGRLTQRILEDLSREEEA